MRVAVAGVVRQIRSVLLKGHLDEEAHFYFIRRAAYSWSTYIERPTRNGRR